MRLLPAAVTAVGLAIGGCKSVDVVLEQKVTDAISEMAVERRFVCSSPECLKDCDDVDQRVYTHPRFKFTVERSLEMLLTAWRAQTALAYCQQYGVSPRRAIKALLSDQEQDFYVNGRLAQFLLLLRNGGVDVCRDEETAVLFPQIVEFACDRGKNSAVLSYELEELVKFFKDSPAVQNLFVQKYAELLMARDNADALWRVAKEHDELLLTKSQYVALANYSDYVRGSRQNVGFVESAPELTKRFLGKALCAEGDVKKNPQIIDAFLRVCYECADGDFSGKNIRSFVDGVRKGLPVSPSQVLLADKMLEYADMCNGSNRLETMVQQGFVPSGEVAKVYCSKLLDECVSFEDVDFFVQQYGNSLPVEKYLSFVNNVVEWGDHKSYFLWSVSRALELAREHGVDVVIPRSVSKKYYAVEKNLDYDLGAVITLAHSLKRDWVDAACYRLGLLAASQDNPVQFVKELAQVTYHRRTEWDFDRWYKRLLPVLKEFEKDPVQAVYFAQYLEDSCPASKKYLKFLGDVEFERGNHRTARIFCSSLSQN